MSFRIGDLVELFRVEDPDFAANIGLRFEVVGAEHTSFREASDGYGEKYVTPVRRLSDGEVSSLMTRCLRKIDRPKDDAEPRSDFSPCDEDFMDRLNSWRPKKDARVAEKSALSDLRKLYEVKAEDEFRAKEIQKLRDFYRKFS
jgi:hypothetical protein